MNWTSTITRDNNKNIYLPYQKCPTLPIEPESRTESGSGFPAISCLIEDRMLAEVGQTAQTKESMVSSFERKLLTIVTIKSMERDEKSSQHPVHLF